MTSVTIYPVKARRARLDWQEPKTREGRGIEALSSYMVGLARAHALQPLAVFQLLCRSQGLDRLARNPRTGERSLHIWGEHSETSCKALAELTGDHGFHRLTLAAVNEFCGGGRQFMRRCRAWCPNCYKDQRGAGLDAWDSLYQYIETTRVCAFHGRQLRNRCARCFRPQPFLPRVPFLDSCNSCSADLSEDAEEPPLGKLRTEQQVWFSTAAEQLVGALGNGQALTATNLKANLRRVRDVHFNKLTAVMALSLGVGQPRLNMFLRIPHKKISWGGLLGLAYRMQIAPAALLSPQAELTNPSLWRSFEQVDVDALPDAADPKFEAWVLDRLREEMDRPIVGRPSGPPQVAQAVGVRQRYLWAKFPEECFQLLVRYRTWVARR
jgi:hypothetical protein